MRGFSSSPYRAWGQDPAPALFLRSVRSRTFFLGRVASGGFAKRVSLDFHK